MIKGSGVAVLSALAGPALVQLTDERLLLWLHNEMYCSRSICIGPGPYCCRRVSERTRRLAHDERLVHEGFFIIQ